mmetsp:Transcript_14553/g.31692  ORF Transcript_14553/g.31692 Transcript_14553/m.31692 type:complete len:491 (+) Transcript_14553:70-1542(+)
MVVSASTMASAERAQTGFYCSTSGTVFTDKESYLEHMRSDFHRYNLKRKVAGLPPVTKEWFEARKAQLSVTAGSAGSEGIQKLWVDPLTKKKFMSENTYQAHVRSKKYQELVRKSGAPAPAPVIIMRKPGQEDQEQISSQGTAAPAPARGSTGFKVVQPSGGLPLKKDENNVPIAQRADDGEDDDSGWETASDEEEDSLAPLPTTTSSTTSTATAQQKSTASFRSTAASRNTAGAAAGTVAEVAEDDDEEDEEWEEWDLCRSLFDNHMSKDFDGNLEYMFKNFGFYFPDADYLKDPEGLMRYLGSKIQYGRVPLYTRGDDANAKQFRSLHAVQRHMVDTNQCKMCYEDNEEEYAQFYDYGPEEEGEGATGSGALVAAGDLPEALVVGGYELMIPGTGSSGGKVLGSREFAVYYRQQHKPAEERQSVVINTMLAKYRALGITTEDKARSLEAKKSATKHARQLKWEGKRQVRMEVFSNFVKGLGKGIGREY